MKSWTRTIEHQVLRIWSPQTPWRNWWSDGMHSDYMWPFYLMWCVMNMDFKKQKQKLDLIGSHDISRWYPHQVISICVYIYIYIYIFIYIYIGQLESVWTPIAIKWDVYFAQGIPFLLGKCPHHLSYLNLLVAIPKMSLNMSTTSPYILWVFPKLWRCTPITGWFMYVYWIFFCRNEVTNVTNGLKPGLLLDVFTVFYSWVPPWLRTPPYGSIVLMLRHGVAFAPRVGNWLAETKPVPQEALNLVG